ncbi:ankyrin repeat domain-containing protein [Legionella sp. km535]|uniref:ankyrin repeat domain-containing protein n=1 Tax=Legionella sp. km535 TaxID=2498107 RepID=UPI000F8C689E|nr:ankyrin repeat domain-containing protein [Legionella sp. km535]RUR20273.1 ankyrin repeat domain-containing protein [Legionella sp. km535]
MTDPRERQIASGVNYEQSTHDVVVSNAAASLAIRLARKYLFHSSGASSSTSSTSTSSQSSPMSLSAEGHASAQARMKHIMRRYNSRKKSILLTETTQSWLATTLSPRSLNPELDRVTLTRVEGGSEMSEEWYMPLPEVYTIVLSALIDTDEQVWPVPAGSNARKQRGQRLQEFDRINNALATAYPPICATGIRHAWLTALNGYEGKRLPLNADDLLFQALFDFMTHKVLGEQMEITLPEGRDPVGEERQKFNMQFQSLFLPWVFGGMPELVKEAIVTAGGPEVVQTLVLSRFHEIDTLPDQDMMKKIANYCSMEGLETIPCNFTPLLAALDHPKLKNAALNIDTTPVSGAEQIAQEMICWLRGPDFLPEALNEAETNSTDAFAKVYLLLRLLDALHQYQTHHRLLNIVDTPAEDHHAWAESIDFLAKCIANQPPSLHDLLSDISLLDRNLKAFERRLGIWKNSAFHDFINNYFANWFATTGDAEIMVRANLFTRLFELFLQENTETQNTMPAIHVSDRMLLTWTDQMSEDGVLDITPYQINRILLHALCYSQDTWSETFSMNLRILLQFLRNRFNEAQDLGALALVHASYPDKLLDYVEHIANRVVPETIPPIFTPGNISPVTSLDVAKFLAVSNDVPQTIIQAVIQHPDFNPLASNRWGLTPIYLAAVQGHIPLAAALLAKGANYLVRYLQYFPLGAALLNGHRSFMQWFFSNLPDDKKIEAVLAKDGDGKSLLHHAANNPNYLSFLLAYIPDATKATAVMMNDERDFSVLFYAASNPLSLKLLLDCLTEDEKSLALMQMNCYGETVLYEAVDSTESLGLLLSCLPEAKKAAAVMTKNPKNGTLLHQVVINPNSLNFILDYIPEQRRAEAVLTTNWKGQTVLYAGIKNPESLKILLRCLPQESLTAAVLGKSYRQVTLLHKATKTPESLKILLDCLTEEERRNAVMAKNTNNETVLQLGEKNPESRMILKAYFGTTKSSAASSSHSFFSHDHSPQALNSEITTPERESSQKPKS